MEELSFYAVAVIGVYVLCLLHQIISQPVPLTGYGMCVCVDVEVQSAGVNAIVYCTGGLVYRSHPSMGKAGKYGARSNGQGLELSRNVKELGRDGGQSIWACRLGLQLDYSTRRTQLAHDVTLEREEGAGRLVCLPVRPVRSLLQVCGANPENGQQDSLAGRPIILPILSAPQNKTNRCHVLEPKRGICLTHKPFRLSHEPKVFFFF